MRDVLSKIERPTSHTMVDQKGIAQWGRMTQLSSKDVSALENKGEFAEIVKIELILDSFKDVDEKIMALLSSLAVGKGELALSPSETPIRYVLVANNEFKWIEVFVNGVFVRCKNLKTECDMIRGGNYVVAYNHSNKPMYYRLEQQ